MKQQVKISKVKGNPDNPAAQDIQKAINHLHFELDRIHNDTL